MGIREKLLKEFQERSTQIYLLLVLVSLGAWFVVPWLTLKVVALFFLCFTQLMYNLFTRITDEKSPKWISFTIISLFTVAYTSALLNELILSAFALHLSFVILFVSSIIIHFLSLWRSKKVFWVMARYLLLSLALIIFFSYAYFVIVAVDNGGLLYSDGKRVSNLGDFVYFSSSVYYSITLGDIFPSSGYLKLGTIIESAISFVVHIIVLGWVIAKINILPKKEKGRKRSIGQNYLKRNLMNAQKITNKLISQLNKMKFLTKEGKKSKMI